MTDDATIRAELDRCFEHDPESNNSELVLLDRLLDVVRRHGGDVFVPPQVRKWNVEGQPWDVWIHARVGKNIVAVVRHPDGERRVWTLGLPDEPA